MEEHEITKWQQLDPVRDAEHLTTKDSLFDEIIACNKEGNRLKSQRRKCLPALFLLAGIIEGYYSNFHSIIDEERITHRMDPNLHSMCDIGPLRNINWILRWYSV